MSHFIIDTCCGVCDTSCVDVCPVDCIHPTKAEWDESYKADLSDKQLYIDPAICIDCGACIPECPVDAIFFEDDLPTDKRHFKEINTNYFKKPQS